MRASTCEMLRCPVCRRGKLRLDSGQQNADDGYISCIECSETFPVQSGIPIFLRGELLLSQTDLRFQDLDEDSRQKVLQRQWHDIAHMDETDFKQASYFSRGLFARLLYYQLSAMETVLRGKHFVKIANVCSGHGHEIEFLSLFGEDIVAFDISWASLLKTVEMGRKIGLSVEGICCDAEYLPVRDDQFDLVLTHHSLHHLANPWRGVEEIVRISRGSSIFFEPAKGITRRVVTMLGLKPEVEESGNVVYEFGRDEVLEFCRDRGLQLRRFDKYLVTGPAHEPKSFPKLDRLGISDLIFSMVKTSNLLIGGWLGTKCSVVIEKPAVPSKVERMAASSCAVGGSR